MDMIDFAFNLFWFTVIGNAVYVAFKVLMRGFGIRTSLRRLKSVFVELSKVNWLEECTKVLGIEIRDGRVFVRKK
jgi:hypothetical protein